MRTDTERLDYLLAIIEAQDDDAAEKLSAAHTLGLKGRPMVDAAMGAKLVEPGEPMPELTALDLAVAELGRIRNVKGFSEEHDDNDLAHGELVLGALAYLHGEGASWPSASGLAPFKPSPDDRKRELTKGIALALCELDRLIRAERRASEQEPAREFKVGDRVRVLSNAHDNRFGWAAPMDALVGQTHPINEVLPQTEYAPIGYRVDSWVFPAEQLERVDG